MSDERAKDTDPIDEPDSGAAPGRSGGAESTPTKTAPTNAETVQDPDAPPSDAEQAEAARGQAERIERHNRPSDSPNDS